MIAWLANAAICVGLIQLARLTWRIKERLWCWHMPTALPPTRLEKLLDCEAVKKGRS